MTEVNVTSRGQRIIVDPASYAVSIIYAGHPGPPGPPGEEGPIGPPGPSGGDTSYRHVQGTPSASWTITHNLNKFPNITVEDSGGSTIEGEIVWNDDKVVTLSFSAAFSGVAYLS